jgi:hypothetical protein
LVQETKSPDEKPWLVPDYERKGRDALSLRSVVSLVRHNALQHYKFTTRFLSG